jgi:hypothetical protein
MNEKPYHIEKRGNTVVLKTTSFKAERGSVLHSGIFNRELASSLAAGAVIVAVSFFFALYFKITVIYLIVVALLFAALFIIFRLCLFHEAVLETVFDREKRTVTLSLRRAMGSSVRSFPLDELSGIRLDHTSFQPENPDAVQFVERIALQHGTVIPGFGKTEDFYTVELDFGGRKQVIFSAGARQGTVAMIAELKSSLNGFLPDTVWMV